MDTRSMGPYSRIITRGQCWCRWWTALLDMVKLRILLSVYSDRISWNNVFESRWREEEDDPVIDTYEHSLLRWGRRRACGNQTLSKNPKTMRKVQSLSLFRFPDILWGFSPVLKSVENIRNKKSILCPPLSYAPNYGLSRSLCCYYHWTISELPFLFLC